MQTSPKQRGFRFTFYVISAAIVLFFPISILPVSAAPAIELSPARGPIGAAVDIEGSGFVALSTVTLTFDKQSLPTAPETIIVDAMGKFEATFHVPNSADEGENSVVATAEIILDSKEDGEQHDDEKDDDKRDRGDKKRDHDDRDDDEKDDEDDDGEQKDDDQDDSEKDDEDEGKGRDHDDNPKNILRSTASTTFIVVADSNNAPVAQSLTITTDEERSTNIILQGSDDDGDAILFSIISDPGHGNLSNITSTGSDSAEIMYTPSPDYNGKDSFEIRVSDSKGDSDTAKVDITVMPVNDAPVASSGEIKTREGELISFSITASDVDSDMLTYVIVANPGHGTLSGTAPNLKYAPSSNYRGSDEFTFKVNDGAIDSNTARVAVTITPLSTHSRSGGGSSDVIAAVSDDANVDTEIALTEATGQPVNSGISQFIADATAYQATSTGTNPFLTVVTSTGNIETTDSQPPKLILPLSPLEIDAISEVGARVTYAASALDDFDGELTPYCSPESGYEFPVGTVNVVCKATDKAGNSALASFVVAVKLIAQEEPHSVLIPFLIMGIVGAASFGGFWAFARPRPG